MKNTTIIIPTRLGAKRFPNKPLAKINGVPMIIHVLNRAKESKIGEVLVATPDDQIFQVVKENDLIDFKKTKTAFTDHGIMVNSSMLNGLSTSDAKIKTNVNKCR